MHAIYNDGLITQWALLLRCDHLLEGRKSAWEMTAWTLCPLTDGHALACEARQVLSTVIERFACHTGNATKELYDMPSCWLKWHPTCTQSDELLYQQCWFLLRLVSPCLHHYTINAATSSLLEAVLCSDLCNMLQCTVVSPPEAMQKGMMF